MKLKDLFNPPPKPILGLGALLKSPRGETYILCAAGPLQYGLIDIKTGYRHANPFEGNSGLLKLNFKENWQPLDTLQLNSLIGPEWPDWSIERSGT
jgi:hypothetical protein